MTARRRDTLNGITDRPPYRWERGPAWLSYLYLMFRQLLAFGDLLGKDGRPSSTKLAAVSIILAGHYVVVTTKAIDWPVVWTYLLGICVLFGWRGLVAFLEFKRDKFTNGDPMTGGV